MTPLQISARSITLLLTSWLIASNVLVWLVHTTNLWPLKIVLFACLALLPGIALIRTLRIRFSSLTSYILYSFGLSILVLMVSGFAINQILYAVGVTRPLELLWVLLAWNIVTGGLIILSLFTNKRTFVAKRLDGQATTVDGWIALALSFSLPFLAAFGAFRLNNGADGWLAAVTLVCIAAFIAYAFIRRHKLPDWLLTWLIFIISLTILCMTSLRGWDIVGHDMAREFRVFNLTQLHGHWDIGLDRDPYNACLSITILPQMFAELLNVSGLLVFKIILQVVFAACPAVIYVLLRRYASKLGALVGTTLFICYPTFINDSAMLTRQGVAYLFFALALLILAYQTQNWRYKLLFVLCALGAILSHYSTAYMFVALFGIAVLCKFILIWWQRRQGKPLKYSTKHTVLSPLFAGLVFAMTFIWYTQVTATADGLITTLHKSFTSIPKVFSDDNKSSDTSTALLFATKKTQVDLYESYLADTGVGQAPKAAQEVRFFPALTSDALPLTPLGRQVSNLGIDPGLISSLRQNFAKFLQVLAVVSVLYAGYRLLFTKTHVLEGDFVYLSLAGIMLLAVMVILPVLSINYGILRAFQQALIFLLLPVTLLLAVLSQYVWARIRVPLATVGTVMLFLLFSGLFAQMLGGVSPSLSMNNRGLYYGLYYAPRADYQSFKWIKAHLKRNSDVRAANFNRALMNDPEYPFTRPGILPLQTKASSFVYLDEAQVRTERFYTYHESSPLIMTFPVEYYDITKDRIYSTGKTRVYR